MVTLLTCHDPSTECYPHATRAWRQHWRNCVKHSVEILQYLSISMQSRKKYLWYVTFVMVELSALSALREGFWTHLCVVQCKHEACADWVSEWVADAIWYAGLLLPDWSPKMHNETYTHLVALIYPCTLISVQQAVDLRTWYRSQCYGNLISRNVTSLDTHLNTLCGPLCCSVIFWLKAIGTFIWKICVHGIYSNILSFESTSAQITSDFHDVCI